MKLPMYKCKKLVRAAKITEIAHSGAGMTTFEFGEIGQHLTVPTSQLEHKPPATPGMYFVQYLDNEFDYFSFSPAGVFEAGYDPLPEGKAV